MVEEGGFAYESHGFAEEEDDVLVGNQLGVSEEADGEGDVEEG